MHADVIINASPLATKEIYRNKITISKLLLGVRFAMVRKEFRALSNKIKSIGQRKDILISFGGTDVLDLTIPVLNVLLKTFDVRIKNSDKVATEISMMAFDLWMDSVQRQNIINSIVEVVDGKGTSRIVDEFF
ncbi:MAG: hypothetical protein JKY84_01890 [Emcibacteraceae bacterium]|nr:hypothetical protein [Emcibacteraceae bacterium]